MPPGTAQVLPVVAQLARLIYQLVEHALHLLEAFVEAFQRLANVATKAGVEGDNFELHTPLIAMTKAEIIRTGTRLGVDYTLTLSCYQPGAKGEACRRCDSCRLRAQGFAAAGVADPTHYQEG